MRHLNKPGWARGLTAATDPRVARMSAAKRGKPNWALGMTAASDPRIAKNVARRLGKHRGAYDVRSRRERAARAIVWTSELAYAVGLIATDGCLVRNRSIDLTSRDREQIATFLRCIGRTNKITTVVRLHPPRTYFRTQVGDVALHDWLRQIGLCPRKSLTLGAIGVPQEFLLDLVRGLLDGDGNISNYMYEVPGGTRRYEALVTSFMSASRAHVTWLRQELTGALGIHGSIQTKPRRSPRHHDQYVLKFGNAESARLLAALYAHPDAPRLERKQRIWRDFVIRHRLGLSHGTGFVSSQNEAAEPASLARR